MQHHDITSALATGYATFSQPTSDVTDYDREEFWKDNAGAVIRWLIQNRRDVLEDYIDEHEKQFLSWLG